MSKWGLLASLVIGAAAAAGAGTAAPALSAAGHAAKPIQGPRSSTAPMARATTQPSTTLAATMAAASQPADGWTVPPLAGELSVLSTRSMFLHGRPPPAHAGPAAPAPGPSLVLRGVARQGEQPMAFVEDVKAKQTRQLHVGDALGTGKLVAITTDGIDRMLGGRVAHVKVGQPIDAAGGAGGLPAAPSPASRPTGIAHEGQVGNEPPPADAPQPPVGATAVVDPAAPAEVSTAGAKLIPGHE